MKDRARSGFALMVVVAVVLGVLIGTRNVQAPLKGRSDLTTGGSAEPATTPEGILSTARQASPAATSEGHTQPTTTLAGGTRTGIEAGTGTGTATGVPEKGQTTTQPAAAGTTGDDPGAATADTAGEGFFSEYRLERSRARSRNIELLQEVVADEKTSEEARTAASMQLVDLSKKTEAEAEAEALIRARGYRDALVFVRGGACDVVVSGPELTRSDAEQIGDIVARCLGLDLANITIIERGD
ncbi:MAG: SpoIIIAH-like family protein [Bacillota bacterium]